MSERPNQQGLLESAEPVRAEGPVPTVRFEDAARVKRVQSGDKAAFAELVSKYQDKLYNTCWRLCGHTEDARDLTQETFLRAYQSIAAFEERSGFYTWLFRIAVNLALSHKRKAKYRQARSLDQEDGTGTHEGPLRDRIADENADPPDQRVMTAEMRGLVEQALGQLEEDYRVVIVLRDMEGFDYAEIAQILDVAPGTVKSRLHRARLALRERLRPDVEGTR